MGTLESSFYGQPEDASVAAPGKQPGGLLGWLNRLSLWLPIGRKNAQQAFQPGEFMSAYGTMPSGDKPVIPEALSRWSTGLKSPLGTGGPGGFLNREKWLILGVTLFTLFWTVVYTMTAFKVKYESKSMLIVKDSAITGSYIASNNPGGQPLTTSSSASNPVLNMIGIINSSAVRTALYEYFTTFKPEALKTYNIKDLDDWESFYGDGASFLKAKNVPGTDLIQVQFTWDEPKTAREALRVLLKAFQDESLNINQAEQRNRSRYLDRQVDELSKKLQQLRASKSQYKRKMSAISLGKQADELTKSRIDLQTSINGTLSKARGKAAEAARYERMLNMTPEQAVEAVAVGSNASVSKLYDTLYSLKQTEANLLASLTEKNPKVVEVQETIKSVMASIQKEEARSLGSAAKPAGRAVADVTRGQLITNMSKAQAEANSLQKQATEMQAMLNKIQGDITEFPMVEEGLTNIEQDERFLSNGLDTLKQKALEAHIKEAETLSNIFIVDQPTLPDKEKFPSKNMILMFGLLSGFGLGVALAFIKHKLMSSNPNDIGSEDDTLFDLIGAQQPADDKVRRHNSM
jgi:uncharacterized protein involved in exopolysaccharide biosynthesis